jgi:hypothetical protein
VKIILLLFLIPLSTLAGCGGPSKAVGAALNVGLAAAVGTARVASGECFTWCDPQHICNPRTGLCEPMPDCAKCNSDQHCQVINGIGTCADIAADRPTTIQDNVRDPSKTPILILPAPDPGPLYQKPVE